MITKKQIAFGGLVITGLSAVVTLIFQIKDQIDKPKLAKMQAKEIAKNLSMKELGTQAGVTLAQELKKEPEKTE